VAAGTPLAILGGIGRAAQLGAIIKGGIFLELLGRVDTIVFDKTGTLTQGQPSVMSVVPQQGVSADDVIRMAAIVEAHSEHPLARAIVNEAKRRGLAVVFITHQVMHAMAVGDHFAVLIRGAIAADFRKNNSIFAAAISTA
jgi:P-type E1-E2 ATPase